MIVDNLWPTVFMYSSCNALIQAVQFEFVFIKLRVIN